MASLSAQGKRTVRAVRPEFHETESWSIFACEKVYGSTNNFIILMGFGGVFVVGC